MPAPLDRIFGGSPIVLRVYGEDGELAGTIGGDRLSRVMIHRGRLSATELPQPGTIGLTVIDGLADDAGLHELDLATRVRVELDPAVMAASFGAGVVPAASLPRWTGQVTDLGDVPVDPLTEHLATPVAGSSLLARVLSFKFDDGEGLGLGTQWYKDQLQNLLTIIWNGDPGVRITPWSTSDGSFQWPAALIATLVGTFYQANAWPFQATAGAWLKLFADSLRAEVIDRRDGAVDFLPPVERRTTRPAAVVVNSSQVIAPLLASKHVGDVLNLVRVGWDANLWPADLDAARGIETRRSTTSIAKYGKLDGDIETNAWSAAAADELGDQYLSAFRIPHWTINSLTVDLGKLYVRNAAAPAGGLSDRALIRALLAAEIGDKITLAGSLPASSVVVEGRSFYITGVDEAITRTSWVMTLAVQPSPYLAPVSRWRDVRDGIRWRDVEDGVTWRFFGAYEPQ